MTTATTTTIWNCIDGQWQEICTSFEKYTPRRHEIDAHGAILLAMQQDLDDRRAMVKDLRQQRNAKVLATYQNVWRLAPRLNARDICTAKTMLSSE